MVPSPVEKDPCPAWTPTPATCAGKMVICTFAWLWYVPFACLKISFCCQISHEPTVMQL